MQTVSKSSTKYFIKKTAVYQLVNTCVLKQTNNKEKKNKSVKKDSPFSLSTQSDKSSALHILVSLIAVNQSNQIINQTGN